LAMVISGPKEPSLEQLNHYLEPMCTKLHMTYKGLTMHIYGFHLPQHVHGCVLCENSDIPATQKLTEAAGHSYKKHPCNYCVILLTDLNIDTVYNIVIMRNN
ncbi:hypothetical protein BD769DRAFT_1366521, partial [Suillus cothurnatus]